MRPRVEILSVAGCPNRQPTRELVERVAAELGVMPAVELVDVPDAAAARRLRFLGSPSVRVDGRDVEPGADERRGYGVSCRVYRTADGVSGQPAASWLRAALRERLPAGVTHAFAGLECQASVTAAARRNPTRGRRR